MIRKYLHLFIFFLLTMLLPLVLFLGFDRQEQGWFVALDDGIVQEDQPVEEAINYRALIFTAAKDAALYPAALKTELETDLPEVEEEEDRQEVAASEPAVASSAPKVEPSAGSSGGNQQEQQMVNLVNEARQSAGLSPLQVSSQLTTAARAKSRDMVNLNYFAHDSPTYGDQASLLSHFGISYNYAAENIAMNSIGSVSMAHNMLMNSPGHRTNILNRNYNYIGIGIQVKNDGSHYYTQLFLGR